MNDTAVRRLLSRGSVFTAATFVQMASAVLVLPFLTRGLDQVQFGRLAVAQVVLQVLAMTATAGMATAVTRSYFVEGQGRAFAAALARRGVTIAGLVAAVAVLLAFAALSADSETWLLWSVAAATGAVLSALLCVQAWLRAEDRALAYVVSAVCVGSAGPAAGVVVVLRGGGPAAYVTCLLVVTTLALLATLALLPRERGAARGGVRGALAVGLPTVPHSTALYLLAGGDRVVISAISGPEDAAVYQVSYVIGSLGTVVLQAVNNAWAPIVYEAGADRHEVLARTSEALMRILAPVLVALLAVAPLIAAVAAPASYDRTEVVRLVCVIVCSTPFVLAYLARAHLVFFSGRTRSLAVLTPAVAVATLLVCMPLVAWIGPMGAAAATVLSYVLLSAVFWSVARHVDEPRPLGRSFTMLVAVTAVAAAGSAALPVAGLGAILSRGLVLLAVVGLVGGWLYRRRAAA